MNKTILLCLALTCLLSLVGCEQKIDTWSGQNVAYINMEVDSTVVSFAYLDEDVSNSDAWQARWRSNKDFQIAITSYYNVFTV